MIPSPICRHWQNDRSGPGRQPPSATASYTSSRDTISFVLRDVLIVGAAEPLRLMRLVGLCADKRLHLGPLKQAVFDFVEF